MASAYSTRLETLAREAAFKLKRATEYRDEDHYDNSFPPSQEYRNRRGPRLLKIRENVTDDIGTSSGFYHDWKRVTTDPGVYVSADGSIYGCDEHGTGHYGSFAAHPGNCSVDVELEWEQLNEDDVSIADLELAEGSLRKLAFPFVSAKLEEGATA